MTDSDIFRMVGAGVLLKRKLDDLEGKVLDTIQGRVSERVAGVLDVRSMSVRWFAAAAHWTRAEVVLDLCGSLGAVSASSDSLMRGVDFTSIEQPGGIVSEVMHVLSANQAAWDRIMGGESWAQTVAALELFYMRCEVWLKVNYACDELKVWVVPNESWFAPKDGGTGAADSFTFLFQFDAGGESRFVRRSLSLDFLFRIQPADPLPFSAGFMGFID